MYTVSDMGPRGVLPYFHTYEGSGHFLVQNFDFQYFFFFFFFFGGGGVGGGGVFRKKIFRVMKILWIHWGEHKIGLYLVVISMHFRVFSESGAFFGLPKFQIFLGCFKLLIFFWCER